ncbi:hypothetical protein [Streptomyces lushanensis]|uniref:hypothetical protein n=1 Tax=Streptomyces lushanensis TaxID=1434255 RepID=UPI001B809FD7|nr:hypothetical protein [Streptomyces lushanensis]
MTSIDKMAKQLDGLVEEYAALVQKSKYDDASDFPAEIRVLMNRLESAIERITVPGSVHRRQLKVHGDLDNSFKIAEFVGIAAALRDDLKEGWTESVVEVVHADTHGDYLEMAEELLSKRYKDPAAVITGTTLEVHVRALCVKHSVDIEVSGVPKKADTMNSDLKKAGVYGGLQQKQITAWMDLRNKAAHGNYTDYDAPQVRLFIDGVRNFMLKYPA